MSIKLTLYLIGGIVLGFYLDIESHLIFWSLIGTLLGLYPINKWQKRRGFPFFGLTAGVTTVLLGAFIASSATSNELKEVLENDAGRPMQSWKLKVREVLKPNKFSQSYIAHVKEVDQKEHQGKLLVRFPQNSLGSSLKIDDEIIVVGEAKEVPSPLNPHGFHYKNYLAKQGVHYQIVSDDEHLLVLKNKSPTLYGTASRFRSKILGNLGSEAFGKKELSVIQALVLGYRDDINEATYNEYKNAGAVHILAVSGLHVGILLLLLQFLLAPLEYLPKGKTLKLTTVVLLLWSYAFVAGLSPSIVRAVTMFTFLAYSMHLNRPTNAFNILALSMFFILLVKPLFLFQVGFQMSYAAVFAIVWLYPKLQQFWLPDNPILKKIWQLLSISIAAQLGVLPISLFYFHQFPSLFFVSNILIVPFLGLLLGFGIVVVVLSLLNALPEFLVATYNFLIHCMNSIVAWIAQYERFVINDIPFDGIQLILAYIVIIALVSVLSKISFKRFVYFASCIMLLQLYGIVDAVFRREESAVILAHQSRGTVLMQRHGTQLNIHTRQKEKLGKWISDYAIIEKIDSISFDSLGQSYTLGQSSLFIMDSLGLHPPQMDYLLLTHSPKIHLDRVLEKTKPKMVFADGSNYRSMIKLWKASCAKKEIPFHSTGEKGFYPFDILKD
nr:ComEC/Rec2 family competence protein [Allomuricauda sp.]